MSSAKARFSASSVIALPPYFTTMVLPWNSFSHGSASTRVAALAVARPQSRGLAVAVGSGVSVVMSLSSSRRSSRARRRA